MPRTQKGRESQRRDIWLTEDDVQKIERIAEHMLALGLNPYRSGKINLSRVVRFLLEMTPTKLGG